MVDTVDVKGKNEGTPYQNNPDGIQSKILSKLFKEVKENKEEPKSQYVKGEYHSVYHKHYSKSGC